ncbi:MAG: Lrp/AsnC ligand binding domain-containing protein [Candidatus Thermoplasmatota archaeon]|jgi:DNA-binding Lrp family transcriptional regulator|nr:Lrp/AsnC ligand binding domain-containing protein [Candidatus Thermoplasmatota archaeon]
MELTEISETLGKFYKDKIVTAIIGVETEVKKVESLAKSLCGHNNVEDIYIVTGEFDILIKVRFVDFFSLNEFLVVELSKMPGIKSSKTMMVLSTVKDSGRIMSG